MGEGKNVRIAIQGERGSFSHEAALQLAPALSQNNAGDAAKVRACALSSEVFERLAQGQADAAVIPIENSLAGSVLEHYDLLLANPVRIERELLLRIRHCLIAAPGVPLASVREVYSHPVALAQCRGFFAAHPTMRAVPFYDTAGAVAHAVHSASGSRLAGIASEQAAREYRGEVLLAGIEDHFENYTRFLLLRPESAVPVAADLNTEKPANKVSLAFAVPNLPGSLVGALEIFARHGLNLSRLESRPVPGSPWEYVFYADYQLDQLDRPGAAEIAFAQLAAHCSFVKELGRYVAAAPLPAQN